MEDRYKAYAEGGEEMNWISVKDKLPLGQDRLLVFERIYDQPVIGFYLDGRWHTEIADDYSDVTHWMPLPESPKISQANK